MIIECPICNAHYNVPEQAISADGRMVRCKKCANEWLVKRPAAAIPPMPTPSFAEEKPAIAKMPEPALAKPLFSPMISGGLAAAFFFALICTLLYAKPSWFGITHTHDIAFANIALAKQATNKGMEYGISGKLLNLADQPQTMPQIRIMLIDSEGSPLKSWSPDGKEKLEAKEEMAFNFAPLSTSLTSGHRLVLDLGTGTELAMRSRP